MRLKNKVAIITGSTDGIGLETARLFAEEGAKVVIVGRREELGNEIVKEITENGSEAIFVKTDVSSEEDNNNMVTKTIDAFGKLDILVCNAAAHWAGTALTAQPEDYDWQFAVNVKGYGLAAKAAIPHLRKSKDGNIVNVSSVNALIGMPGQSIYNATKAAIIELSHSFAIDFPDLRINALLPGFTKTESMDNALIGAGFDLEEGYRLLGEGTLRKRLAESLEVAKAILFLASEDASYITASSLLIDGGIANVGNPGAGLINDKRFDELLGR